MSGPPDSLALLRRRGFRLLFSAQAVSWFGDRIVNVALAFAVLGLTRSASAVGVVLAARMLPMVACLLAGGVVADRTSPRAVMVAADLVRLAAQGGSAALLVGGAAEVWSLAVLAGVSGAATGFFNPASTGLLPAVVEPADLQRANGLRVTAMAVGEIGGPVVGGALVASAGAGWALGVDAATFAASAALLVRLPLPPRLRGARTSFLADLRDGWQAFRSRTWVWTVVASVALINVLWAAWSVLGPVVAKRDLGGAAAWGAILAAMGGGALGGGLLAIRARPRRPLVTSTLACALIPLPLALLAAGAPAAVVAGAAAIGGAGMMLATSVWESTLQRHVPQESLSRVSAYDWFGSLAFSPLGYAAWGPVAAALGLHAALWLAFALMTACALVLLAVPDIRRLTDLVATGRS